MGNKNRLIKSSASFSISSVDESFIYWAARVVVQLDLKVVGEGLEFDNVSIEDFIVFDQSWKVGFGLHWILHFNIYESGY